jgi:prepilin-type N-terminal cleavage/methylation domain-containing protein
LKQEKITMTNKQTTIAAYTLIEVMIVLTLIGISSAIVFTGWSNGRVEQQLDSAGREVEAAIREAQNYALTGLQGVAGTEPCQFLVDWTGAASTYRITYRSKNAGGVCDAATDTVIRPYVLKNGVTFSAGGNFSFSLPHAIVGGGPQTIVLTKAGSNQVVCVKVNGQIQTSAGVMCP